MAQNKNDPTGALVIIMKALEPLEAPDRQWVLQSAAARWSLALQGQASPGDGQAGAGSPGIATNGSLAASSQAALTKKDPRAFMRIKNPSTDTQRIACLAYFLVHTTGKLGFSSKEIREANTNSGGTSINLTRALDNATRKTKYLSKRGPREKQLTTLGEDIAVALPDQQAVRDIEATAGSRRKGAKKKKN